MSDMYILKDKIPIKTHDLMEWGEWNTPENRRVARDEAGGHIVSTVFLGLDHAHTGGPPILFETMVFDKDGTAIDEHTSRYSTWDAAESGHASVLAYFKAISGDSS